ncbi:MAG: MBL fold metallo-hydrolase RNA specificity domain-containing protein [Pseudobdellovibrionaceae bacterium]
MSVKIQFLGGAETVTGSKYLVTYGKINFLVDCGLFQGIKNNRLKNWDGFPIDATELDFIILTHAHIDHSGFIPRLIKKGFRGKIYSTAATCDLCRILLPDAGHLFEEEANYLNKVGKSKHKPALPLFTEKEAEESLHFFEPVNFSKIKTINPDLKFEFQKAGHILGAASVILELGSTRIGFSGDIGRMEDPIFFAPDLLPPLDYLIIESTYGNRLHPKSNPLDDFEKLIHESYQKKGVVIVPTFAVGRAQTLMYYLWKLKSQHRIPDIPMYLNSPMATDVNELLSRYKNIHKLEYSECREVCQVVKYVRSIEDSIALNKRKGPMLILSASGMLTGGRVLHHLKAFAPYAENTILLTGFQAAGTRGAALRDGAEEIKIHGEYIPVRAQVKVLDNMSAHADYREIIQWLARAPLNPKRVFVTHGEPAAADELRRRLAEKFAWNCYVPEHDETIILG